MKTTLEQEIQKCDMGALIAQMNSYAAMRLYWVSKRPLAGKSAEDVVMDVFLSILRGQRNWDGFNADFQKFCFGCLKSEISHLLKRIEDRSLECWRVKDYLFGICDEDVKPVIKDKKLLFGAFDDYNEWPSVFETKKEGGKRVVEMKKKEANA